MANKKRKGLGTQIYMEGEKQFQKQIDAITDELKTLATEAKLVTSAYDKNDKSAEKLTARNSVLQKEIEEQTKKLDLYKERLKAANEAEGVSAEEKNKLQREINNTQASINKMQREVNENTQALEGNTKADKDAEKATDELGKETDQTSKSLSEAGKAAKTAANIVGKTLKAALAVTAAAAVALSAAFVTAGKNIWKLANETAEAGDEIDKNSQKVGLSYEAYQKWDYAMKIAGTEMSACTTGLKTLTNTFDDANQGSSSAITKFERLGLSMEDLQGLSREDLFETVVKALQNVADETEKAALANDLFGKSGQELLPLFNMTSEELEKVMGDAEKYGMVMSDAAVIASAAFEDSLTKLKGTFSGIKNNAVGEILPSLSAIMDGIADVLAGNGEGAASVEAGVEELGVKISGFIDVASERLEKVMPSILKLFEGLLGSIGKVILKGAPKLLKHVEGIIPQALQVILSALPSVISSVGELVESAANTILAMTPDLLTALNSALKVILDMLPRLAIRVLDVVLENFDEILLGLVGAFPALASAVTQLVVALCDRLPEIMRQLTDILPQILTDVIFPAIIDNLPLILMALTTLIGDIALALPDLIGSILDTIPELIDQIGKDVDKESNVKKLFEAVGQMLFKLGLALPKLWWIVVQHVPKIVDSVISALVGKEEWEKFKNVGAEWIRGIWEGILSVKDWLVENIGGFFGGVIGDIKDFLGIKSPSKVMADLVGKPMALGVGKGFDDAMSDVEKEMRNAIPADFDIDARANLRGTTFSGSPSPLSAAAQAGAGAESEELRLMREQNALLRALLDKNLVVAIGDEQIGRANARYTQARGAVVTGGAYSYA